LLLHSLHSKGFFTLNHFRAAKDNLDKYSLGSGFFRLDVIQGGEWSRYTFELNRLGTRLSHQEDKLFWKWNKIDGTVTTKVAYDTIYSQTFGLAEPWWAYQIWTWKAPLKLKCFMWLLLHNRILT